MAGPSSNNPSRSPSPKYIRFAELLQDFAAPHQQSVKEALRVLLKRPDLNDEFGCKATNYVSFTPKVLNELGTLVGAKAVAKSDTQVSVDRAALLKLLGAAPNDRRLQSLERSSIDQLAIGVDPEGKLASYYAQDFIVAAQKLFKKRAALVDLALTDFSAKSAEIRVEAKVELAERETAQQAAPAKGKTEPAPLRHQAKVFLEVAPERFRILSEKLLDERHPAAPAKEPSKKSIAHDLIEDHLRAVRKGVAENHPGNILLLDVALKLEKAGAYAVVLRRASDLASHGKVQLGKIQDRFGLHWPTVPTASKELITSQILLD